MRVCFKNPDELVQAAKILGIVNPENLLSMAEKWPTATIQVDLDSGQSSILSLGDDTPNVERHLDLSTAHAPSSNPDFGSLRFEEHEYGWIVWTWSDNGSIPDWIGPILDKAKNLNCQLILFDCDAERCEDFFAYDW